MTKFQVSFQDGEFRRLQASDFPLTPWLFKIRNDGLHLENKVFRSFALSEGGVIGVNPLEKELLTSIPNYSFLMPLLSPSSEFEDSLNDELTLFLERTQNYELPEWFGIVYEYRYGKNYLSKIIDLSPSIIVLRNTPVLTQKPKKLLEEVSRARSEIPEDIALYYPGGGSIGFQTLLVSLGVDILDTGSVALSSLNSLSFRDGFIRRDTSTPINQLLEINEEELVRDFNGISTTDSLFTRLLREMHASSAVATAVKFQLSAKIDLQKVNLGRRYPLYFIGDESLHHPVVMAYSDRLLSSYQFPDADVLLLVPCSAKKPYRESKSHRIFEKAIKQSIGKDRRRVVIWSLTSPLGVVPEELEDVFPASNYDIPVTGDWSVEESVITGTLLNKMISRVPQTVQIVVHVSEGYRKMVDIGLKGRDYVQSHIGEKPTSSSALGKLQEALRSITFQDQKGNSKNILRNRKLLSLLKWQYGGEFSLPLDQLKFRGRPPRPISILRQGVHWMSWDIPLGKVKPSIVAIENSNLRTDKTVIFDGDVIDSSMVFAPGVIDAGESIAPGDEVIITSEDKEVLALGMAVVSGRTMKRITRGAAVKIRKRKKKGGK